METTFLVAGTGTVAILANRFITAIPGFVLAGPIVTRMTTRTVRLERRILPGDGLGIGFVAFRTLQVATVILRLVRQRRMTVICRCPGIGGMAHVALQRRAEVIRVLTRRDCAVVTG